jgi:hypothetical protein
MSRRDPDADLDFDDLARRAADGDPVALAELVRGLQHPMYRLALRFSPTLRMPKMPPGDPDPNRQDVRIVFDVAVPFDPLAHFVGQPPPAR